MELEDAIEYAENPGKIIDPGTCNFALAIINGKITDQEEDEFEKRLEVDIYADHMMEEYKVNAIVDRKIRLTTQYQEWQASKRELARLKRLRNTLSERFTVITLTSKRY